MSTHKDIATSSCCFFADTASEPQTDGDVDRGGGATTSPFEREPNAMFRDMSASCVFRSTHIGHIRIVYFLYFSI